MCSCERGARKVAPREHKEVLNVAAPPAPLDESGGYEGILCGAIYCIAQRNTGVTQLHESAVERYIQNTYHIAALAGGGFRFAGAWPTNKEPMQ